MAAVSGADGGRVTGANLVVSYVVIATALVWASVGFVILAPNRAAPILERTESWVSTHARGLRVWISLAFGAALLADGLLRLVA
ncbi:MAG: GAP family protein [Acidimicrobiia bacterium]|nr:GAP family protein [Acidimicrobiia bacterium]